MKHTFVLITLFVVSLFVTTSVDAQDPKDYFKDASKDLKAYEINSKENFPKLISASESIEKALDSDIFRNDAEVLNTAGLIYNSIATHEIQIAKITQDMSIKHPKAASKAFMHYKKALENADKNRRERDAKDGLMNTASSLSDLGNLCLNTQEYGKAFRPLNEVVAINQILKDYDGTEVFQNEADLNNHKFVTAIAAQAAGDMKTSEMMLEELYNNQYDDARVYSYYFNILNAKQLTGQDSIANAQKAAQVLNKGKEMYPDNTELMYAEINYLIKSKQFDKLESKLQTAIEKDPENPSIRNALGNVYMNLYENAVADNDTAQQKKYYNQAIDYFEQAIELNPKFFDAIYSLGSMYFNKAAALTQEMTQLGMSNEDLKKYDELDKKVQKLFNKSLPYFKKAEMMKPSDLNTLIGLKEIYARLDNMEMTKVFSDRVSMVQGGQEIEESYFESNE